MWSTNVNNIIAGVLVALWLLAGSNYVGNILIPPFEPVPEAQASGGEPAKPGPKAVQQAVTQTATLPILLATATADKGQKIAKKKCRACHSFDKGGKNKVGPNLFGIMGQDRASVASYNYSGAIKKMGGQWGFTDMDQFLTKPKTFMPGTKMTFNGLKKAGDRAAVILYLRGLADAPLPLPK